VDANERLVQPFIFGSRRVGKGTALNDGWTDGFQQDRQSKWIRAMCSSVKISDSSTSRIIDSKVKDGWSRLVKVPPDVRGGDHTYTEWVT
jgi:hypothetical protein